MQQTKRAAVEMTSYGTGYRARAGTGPAEIGTGGLETGALLKTARKLRFSPRDVIYREGDSADTIYAIHSGLVKLLSFLPNGRGRIIRLYGRGIWIGLEGLLRRPYEHTAVAVDQAEVYRMSADSLRMIEQEDPRHHQHFMVKWHEHLLEADMWISDFSTGSIKSRVARLIKFLSRIQDRTASGHVKLLTCDEMAAILGVTPESVSRVIAGFKRGGILRAPLNGDSELYQCSLSDLERFALQ
jgi:CRP/FNR family transcriptional regulator